MKPNFLEPLDYDQPGHFPSHLIARTELYHGEFNWLITSISPKLGQDDALKFISSVFWSRYTGDSGYYQCAFKRYESRLFGVQIPKSA